MLELLCLLDIIKTSSCEGVIIYNNKLYNAISIYKRIKELKEELLEPYVIDNNSKE